MTERAAPDDADPVVRDIGPADLDWLLALNNLAVPHVNQLDRRSLADILQLATYARCVGRGGRPAGALIGLPPGTAYASDNYRWFDRHHADFLYIDRVMIDATSRKGGLGRLLYADFERFAEACGARHLACEVNSLPPNPISLRFHQSLGFGAVAELANAERSKCVVLMMKPVTGGEAKATRSSRRELG
ncbi:MAG: GNAT family N-acetyltransferase [Rhizobiales bacterium]|nr:GNAT family N-acetyltransferase [Hyphomicrobiales bacterium]